MEKTDNISIEGPEDNEPGEAKFKKGNQSDVGRGGFRKLIYAQLLPGKKLLCKTNNGPQELSPMTKEKRFREPRFS